MISSFKYSALDIVGVGGASATVRGYIDVPLQIASAEIVYLLLIVENLSFPLLTGTDILRPHASTSSFDPANPLQLTARVCDVCLKQRDDLKHKFRSSPSLACTTEAVTVAPNTAILVSIRMLRSAQEASTVVIEFLNLSAINFGIAPLPAVCAPIDGTCRIAIVNPTNRPIEILAGCPIASVKSVD